VDEQGREYSEDWELGSGFTDDFDGTVVNSEFGYEDKYADDEGNKQVLFIAMIQPDDGSDQIRQLFSVGKEFEVVDGGRGIAKPKSGKLIKTTMYGRAVELGNKLWPDMKFRGSPLRIGPWDGTSWHWKVQEFKMRIRGEERVNEHLMPTKFNKLVSGGTGAGTASGSAGSAGGNSGGGNAGDDVRNDLKALALTNDTHQLFLKAVVGDKELNARVKAAGLTREVIDAKDTGYWIKSRKEAGI